MASKGETAGAENLAARFLCTKLHSWRGKYARIVALTNTQLLNLDPSDYKVTNTWSIAPGAGGVVDFSASAAAPSEFSLTLSNGKKSDVRERRIVYLRAR